MVAMVADANDDMTKMPTETGSPSIQEPISVVVVTYNRVRLLDRTIKAVLTQSYGNFELLIADDASTDGSQEVCERAQAADRRVRYVRRTTNLGMPQNLNLGLREARYDSIAILHDDDQYSPRLLESWKRALDAWPTAGFVFNAYQSVSISSGELCITCEPFLACTAGRRFLERAFFARWRFDSPVWGCAMVRKKALEVVGYPDEHFGFWADVDFWMRLAAQFDVAYVPEPLITITAATEAPHQFDDDFQSQLRLIAAAFLAARRRHYPAGSCLARLEQVKHRVFLAAVQCQHAMFEARHRIMPGRSPRRQANR